IAAISLSEKGPRPAEAEAALNHGALHAAAAVRRGAGRVHLPDAGRGGVFGAALFFGETMITPAISPGSDRNSLNRAVRAVLADGGSVLIIDQPGRRRVRGARGRPVALPLRLGGKP